MGTGAGSYEVGDVVVTVLFFLSLEYLFGTVYSVSPIMIQLEVEGGGDGSWGAWKIIQPHGSYYYIKNPNNVLSKDKSSN